MSWKNKIKYEGDCWMWTACTTDDGYGNYRGRPAHRVVYAELCGEPAGRLVNHCGSKACVNPEHWGAPTEGDRFWARVDLRGPQSFGLGECWLWVGGVDGKGYGAFRDRNGAQTLAHRKAWELTYGSYPTGLLLHLCDTPRCIRPEHMRVGDQAANIADAVAKGRMATCERHGAAKLTWAQVREIRQRHEAGEPQVKLAKDFDVSQVNISNIVRGKTWREN
jgi:hypothetical protein